MKLTVIGGGGVRSMFLSKSIAQKASELNICELTFMDTDEVKLNIYGKMAKKIAELIDPNLNFTLTNNAVTAIKDADYVITTIRAGGDDMRVKDERIALSLGLLGQETTGAAGFSFAMRSINALDYYCKLIKEYASPKCKVFNFTNPAGLVSQALRDMGYDFTYGICDAPSGMLRSFEKLYNKKENSALGELYGLNHLSYFTNIKIDGKDMLWDIIENDRAYSETDLRYFDKELLYQRKAILNEYLYYYYYPEKAIKNILASDKTRGELIRDINYEMTQALSNIDIDKEFDRALEIFEHYYGIRENNYMASETGVKRKQMWKFDPFSKDSGGYAGVALKFIEISQSGKKGEMILCTENRGAISGLKDNDIVEITCDIEGTVVTPHKFFDIDEENLEMIRRVKIYERLASKAIREKSVACAIDALTLHPLVNSYSLAKRLVSEYIELNRDYIGEWN